MTAIKRLSSNRRSKTLLGNRRSRCAAVSIALILVYARILVSIVEVVFRTHQSDDVSDSSESGYLTRAKPFPSWNNLNSSAVCSPGIFRSYYAERDYFPGEGQWVADDDVSDDTAGGLATTTSTFAVDDFSKVRILMIPTSSTSAPSSSMESTNRDRYVPEICKFRYGGRRRPFPADELRKCLRRKNISSVATMGDSNGAHHFDAMVRLLNESENGSRCRKVASEVVDHTLLMPDVAYYARHDRQLNPLLRATYRHCSSCVSRTHLCRANGGDDETSDELLGENIKLTASRKSKKPMRSRQVIQLEHLSMVSVLDSSIKIDVPHNHFAVNLQYRADTYQVHELMLRA